MCEQKALAGDRLRRITDSAHRPLFLHALEAATHMETELATSIHPAIRRLPLREATLVRSACALPSIAAIAEELVLNALDAGASECLSRCARLLHPGP